MPYNAETIVVGCGNTLFKDDGFGPIVVNILEKYFKSENSDDFDPAIISYIENDFPPAMIERLENSFEGLTIPDNVKFIDAGTGATHFIFSLPDEKWRKVIVVDVVEFDAEPGTVKVFSPFDMPKAKYENVHTWPVEEPLHELSKNCEVVIVGCKPKEIPSPDVDMGLTEPVEKAIPEAIEIILKEIGVKECLIKSKKLSEVQKNQ
ncbi:coenzyme F420-reducing hydrogenase, FrhD protein [Methanobrevibacter oralis]|uniref:Hydrogenase 3 maturation protease n=1 Tax=Methanobrevibacter oralis TaxID=66851 RepID=A0A166ADK2_METOA|nr:coenzyme F420-reducing hydrogenase, FrhD protein [Methanobrevibacter oralis]KZX11896.1 hydrogenase 3 maturation protease [Methanobrevibacter oralis]